MYVRYMLCLISQELIKSRKKELSQVSSKEDQLLREQEIEMITNELHKRTKQNSTIEQFIESCAKTVKLLQSKSGSLKPSGIYASCKM